MVDRVTVRTTFGISIVSPLSSFNNLVPSDTSLIKIWTIDKFDEMVNFAHVNAHTMMNFLLRNTTGSQTSCVAYASCSVNLTRQ